MDKEEERQDEGKKERKNAEVLFSRLIIKFKSRENACNFPGRQLALRVVKIFAPTISIIVSGSHARCSDLSSIEFNFARSLSFFF